MIELIKDNEITTVVDMHYKAFKGELTSDLGEKYINFLFTNIKSSKNGIVYVHKIDSNITGFACGTSNIKELWNFKFKLKLMMFGIVGVFRKPSNIPKMFRYLWINYHVGKINTSAHMLSIVVLNEHKKKGIGIELVKYFSNYIKEKGLENYLIPYTDEYASNFYQKIGFKLVKSIKFFKKKTNCFRYDLL